MNRHYIPKSPRERSDFKRYIREQDYEPTLDERVAFAESDKGDQDYSVPTSTGRRRDDDGLLKFKEFIQRNWFSWLIAIFGIILFFFMVDSKVDLATIFEKTDQMKDDIGIIKEDIDELIEVNHQQDLEIKEIQVRNIQISPQTPIDK